MGEKGGCLKGEIVFAKKEIGARSSCQLAVSSNTKKKIIN